MNTTAAAAAAPEPMLTAENFQEQTGMLVRTSTNWIGHHWLEILIALGAAFVIVALLHLLRRWGMKLCHRTPGVRDWSDVIGKAISRTGNFFIVTTAAKLVVGYAYAPPGVSTTIGFLFTIAAVFQAAIWARELILGFVEMRTESDTYHGESLATALGLIRVLVTVALFSIALIVVLSNLGVNVTGLVAGLGVGGIAIGLAAQGIFADLFAALSIIFDKPFRRGDSISYDDTFGSIESIGLKSTRIRAFTGEERIISNKNLLDKEILNNTQRAHRRNKLAIGVIYQTEPEVCRRIPEMLQEIVEANGLVFVRAGFTGFGDSSLDFEVEFDSEGADFVPAYAGRTNVGLAILERFNKDGIEFAYPTQTTFTSDPDGKMIMPYPQVQPVVRVDKDAGEDAPRAKK